MARAKDKGKDAQKKGNNAARVAKSTSMGQPKAAAKGKDPAKVAAGKAGAPKKGERRGGRKPGTPNKRTVELREALERAGLNEDTHPVVMMFKVYTGEITMPVLVRKTDGDESWDEVEDIPLEPGLRVKCMAEVAQYLEPKRKAVDKDGSDADKLIIEMIDPTKLKPSGVGTNQG